MVKKVEILEWSRIKKLKYGLVQNIKLWKGSECKNSGMVKNVKFWNGSE